MLSKSQVLEQFCLIQRLVNGLSGREYPNDGFCQHCDKLTRNNFQSSGSSLGYILSAVLEKAEREGNLEEIQKTVENTSEEFLAGLVGEKLKELFL